MSAGDFGDDDKDTAEGFKLYELVGGKDALAKFFEAVQPPE